MTQVLSLPSIARFTIFNHGASIRAENFKFSSVLNLYCPFNKIWGGRMKKKKAVLGLVGILAAVGLVSSFAAAASVTPVLHPESVHYKRLGPCTWYGEDYETKSLSLLGGGWAYASAYFHTCTPCYWYDGKNSGGVYGYADLILVWPRNGLCSVETDTYFSVLGAAREVSASVGVPPGSV